MHATLSPEAAQLVLKKKNDLIKKWFAEFNAPNDASFENLYRGWDIDAFFGNYTVQFSLPPVETCEDALNDKGCDWERFNNFFQEHLTVK